MNKLDRYIGSHVLLAMLSVLGVILMLALLFAFVDEMGDVEGAYHLANAVEYVMLTTPRRLYELLPMGVLVGCLVGLGVLASSSELTVMRAAGLSLGRITWAAMQPMLFLVCMGLVIGEYLAPWSEDLAQTRKALIMGQGAAQSSGEGLWHRQQNDFIHINAVQPNGVLLGVTRYQFDKQRQLQRVSFARQADYQGEGKGWLLKNIATTHLETPEQVRVEHIEQLSWDLELTPKLLLTVVLEPEAHSITGLWHYIHYLQEQGMNNQPYWLAFWDKTLQPLSMVALVLLAVSFVFGPLRSVTLGQRIFTGVTVGFVFRILQDLLGPASQVYGFSPLLAVALPILACALIGLLLLRRTG